LKINRTLQIYWP